MKKAVIIISASLLLLILVIPNAKHVNSNERQPVYKLTRYFTNNQSDLVDGDKFKKDLGYDIIIYNNKFDEFHAKIFIKEDNYRWVLKNDSIYKYKGDELLNQLPNIYFLERFEELGWLMN